MSSVQEWLSSNKNRNFPFIEDANLGVFPRWALLDFMLINTGSTLTASEYAESVVCDSFTVDGDFISVKFTYTQKDSPVDFSFNIERGAGIVLFKEEIAENILVKAALFGGSDEYYTELEDGEYKVGAKILPTRIVSLSTSRKLMSVCGLTGKIKVVDGYNTAARIAGDTIEIKTGRGFGLGSYCDKSNESLNCTNALMFINGQRADSDGNIDLCGGDGVNVIAGGSMGINGKSIPTVRVKATPLLKNYA